MPGVFPISIPGYYVSLECGGLLVETFGERDWLGSRAAVVVRTHYLRFTERLGGGRLTAAASFLLEIRHGVNPFVIGPGLITWVHGCTFGTLLFCVRHSGCMISRR